MRLSLGKLPPELLRKYVLGMTGAESDVVLSPPDIGLDFGVLKLKSGYLITHSDPVTGVRENVGWYAVNVSANDVATSGNRPQFMQSVLLFPKNAPERLVKEVSSQVHTAAKGLGISIVGGHTELTPGLNHTIVVATSFAVVESYVTAAGAKEGDMIMMTKAAALEGTSILATEWRRLGLDLPISAIRRAKNFAKLLSVVEEARTAYLTGSVHAMHDCTEGGVLGAVYEMALASRLGFEIHEKKIPVARETRLICDQLNKDPLRLIGSGSLLLSVGRGKETKVRQALERLGVPTAEIGRFTRGAPILFRTTGKPEKIAAPPADELWGLTR